MRDNDGLQLHFVAMTGVKGRATSRRRHSSISSIPQRRAEDARRRRAKLAALRRESDRALIDLIRRRLALPPEKRTNFLRKRVTVRGTAL
jgi:hypothetical protein